MISFFFSPRKFEGYLTDHDDGGGISTRYGESFNGCVCLQMCILYKTGMCTYMEAEAPVGLHMWVYTWVRRYSSLLRWLYLHQRESSTWNQQPALCSPIGTRTQNVYPLPSSICSALPPAACYQIEASGITVTQSFTGLPILFLNPLHFGSDKRHFPGSCKTASQRQRKPISLPPSCPKFHPHDTETQLEMRNTVHYLGSAEKNVMALFSSCFYAFKNMLISFF